MTGGPDGGAAAVLARWREKTGTEPPTLARAAEVFYHIHIEAASKCPIDGEEFKVGVGLAEIARAALVAAGEPDPLQTARAVA